MFKKKPNIKTLSPLRSSDRRKIADQIIRDFEIETAKPDVPENDSAGDEQPLFNTSIGSLRNALLPEGSLSAKFSTFAGPDLKPVNGTVYVGSRNGDEVRILWLKLNDRLIPTVYTLWVNPQIVPLLHTPSVVLKKLQGGADLMTPGLQRGPPFPIKAKKDSIVAVASLENPSVPLVVGICKIDVSSLEQVQGIKGHAVEGVHWSGDEIWAWSQTGKPGAAMPHSIEAWDPADLVQQLPLLKVNGDANHETKHGNADLEEMHVGDSLRNDFIDDEEVENGVEKTRDMPTRDIDDAFRNAFLYSMHDHIKMHKVDPHHGIEFPITQSLLMSKFIIPYLPTLTAVDTSSLQIKKTSWKNAKRFIKALDKSLLLKSKDRNGGETVILDVGFEDAAIQSFVPYKLPKKDSSNAELGNGKSAIATISSSVDPAIGQSLKRVVLLKPRDDLSPIFHPEPSTAGSRKMLFLPQEVRNLMTDYFAREALVSEKNKRIVTLDPLLSSILDDSRTSLDREVIAKGSIPREALIERVQQKCSPFWALLRNEEILEDVKPKAGHPPEIRIQLETRSGNKTATRITGLEVFYLSPQLLADELQKACASSVSVGVATGSSPKHPTMEIMVQGSQTESVCKALAKRGVDKRWVMLIDRTKGKKQA